MLGTVKDKSVSRSGHGGNEVGVLRHVASFVDLTGMVDLLDDVEGYGLLRRAEAAQFFSFGIVVCWTGCRLVWKVDLSNLKVVLSFPGGVCSDDETVGAVVFARHRLNVRQPLRGESGPLQGAAVHDIVEEDGVLLPDFVLLVDHLVFDLRIGGHVAQSRSILVGHCGIDGGLARRDG